MHLPKTTIINAVLEGFLLLILQCTASANAVEQATAIKKLQFLIGTWKSVAQPDDADAVREIRTITVCPDGQSLSVTSESVLQKQRPVQITFEAGSGKYVFTSKTPEGDERIFYGVLTADGKLEIPIPPQSSGLFSGLTFIVTVNEGEWTETLGLPSKETFYRRSFVRQHHGCAKSRH